jgi:DNA-directed RNA polymerase subunit beta'
VETKDLVALRISLASPETIRGWSYGEVTKPETINYRRLRPEKDGLFCEAIFGPTRDWQCYCGKYKNPRYKGIVCDKCGVEVTRSSVRRERMGHIELASPVAHIWYTRRIPSYLGLLLSISRRNLDRVLYFAQYIVTYVDEDARDKALDRLNSELETIGTEQDLEINARIDQIKIARDEKLAELSAEQTALEAQSDEEIAKKLQPIMAEGQRLEQDLREKIGQQTTKPIIFSQADVVIVKANEVIDNKHVAAVQKAVKTQLDEMESEARSQHQREIEQIKLSKEEVKAESDRQMQDLQVNLADELSEKQERNARLRDELMELQSFTFLSEARYRELKNRWGQVFRADMGAEAFYDILKRLDLDKLTEDLWHEMRTTKSKQKRKRATTRLKVAEAFRQSGNKPEWMIMTVLPVIPPDLRPMVQLDGGRFATSDLNDLYRRVINRNNRLKRLLELGAPDVIVRNEKRMLQEAVDSLIDNSQRGKALSRRGRRELKSLSDMLKGKKGRFRRNLLGKRVDYSGRSVIVVGPQLKLYQCGLPKSMALELYRPFVISRLVSKEYVLNVKGARRFIERNRPEVWEVLEEVIQERPVLLNRAPTLHRLGIQAFEPILIEGSAIQLHPLVTTAFNADFDGDQMAVHVPLSEKAVWEARNLMLASKNLLKPADGEPIISPSKDMVLGVYYLTMVDEKFSKENLTTYSDFDEVELDHSVNKLSLHQPIKIYHTTWYDEQENRLDAPVKRIITTTIGRVIFNRILPDEVHFTNKVLEKGGVKDLIAEIYEYAGPEKTIAVVDEIKDIGFKYAMTSGFTIAVGDITVPADKEQIIQDSQQEVDKINRSYRRGLLTEQERDDRTVDIWQKTTKKVGQAVRDNMDPMGNLSTMAISGATKGGFGPIAQLAGMRGLMADPSGRIILLPIRSNFREGLTALEYFISTHGSRKGLADTALRTADAGYLTRRLVDIAQDLIINEHDCGTESGIWLRRADDIAGQDYGTRLIGRRLAKRVVDPRTGEILAERNDTLDRKLVRKIVSSPVEEVYVRSSLACESTHGLCAYCYGMDLGSGKEVELGAAVGTVAAQSIGEPGTQLTLRTFHSGGVASTADITTGLPRVEELFEARRTPKGEALISEIGGKVTVTQSDRYSDQRIINIVSSELMSDVYEIPEGWEVNVEDGDEISAKAVIALLEGIEITSQHAGRIRLEGDRVVVSWDKIEEQDYDVPSNARLLVKDGEMIEAGTQLTEGSINPHKILAIKGRETCQVYLLNEIQTVYRAQGQNINDKHFEVIIRKMLGRVQVTESGDSEYLPNDLIDAMELRKANEALEAEGRAPAKYIDVLLGITKASLTTDSWLSASSFQHTIKVLAGASIASSADPLWGLKENVIIGKLIPAGTGFIPGKFEDQRLIDLIADSDPHLNRPIASD